MKSRVPSIGSTHHIARRVRRSALSAVSSDSQPASGPLAPSTAFNRASTPTSTSLTGLSRGLCPTSIARPSPPPPPPPLSPPPPAASHTPLRVGGDHRSLSYLPP